MSLLTNLKRFIVKRQHLKQPLKKLRADIIRIAGFLLGPNISPLPKILGYHTVGQGQDDLSLTPEQFEEQLDWLEKNRFNIITVRQWWSIVSNGQTPAPRTVILTFDDGLKGTITHAAPILAKRGLAATVFIVTNHVGGTNNYDRFLNTPEIPMMSWSEILELKRLGWDIQSHGHRHLPHYKLAHELRYEELNLSKEILEERLRDSVDFFCFPYGSFDHEAPRTVSSAGYLASMTCIDGALTKNSINERYLLPRTLVYGSMSLTNFISTFRSGHYRLLKAWWSLKQKVTPKVAPESIFDELDQLILEEAIR